MNALRTLFQRLTLAALLVALFHSGARAESLSVAVDATHPDGVGTILPGQAVVVRPLGQELPEGFHIRQCPSGLEPVDSLARQAPAPQAAGPELACPTLPWDNATFSYYQPTQTLSISWPAPTGADASTVYEIYTWLWTGNCSSGSPQLAGETALRSYSLTVPLNRKLLFHVKVKNCTLYNPGGSLDYIWWSVATFTQQATPPSLAGYSVADTTVTLSYVLQSDQFATLNFYRSPDGVTWTWVAGLGGYGCPVGTLANYSLSGQPAGTWRYRLGQYYGIAAENFSNYVVVTVGCTYSVSPSSASVGPGGATGQTFTVTSGTGCSWTAVSNNSWITVTGGASGSGNGTVTYSVASNPGGARTGTITAGGQTFTVTQSGCTYSLSPSSATVPSAGASGQTFSLTTGTGCSWTAVSNNSWITVTGGASGSGNGMVTYSVAPNPGGARTGTITAGGQTFTVTQSGCTYSLSPPSATLPAGGASGQTFSVVADAGCPWSASSNNDWISITSGASGSGSGTVTYAVTANPGSSRTGSITAAGKTFTVSQAGCGYLLRPASASVGAAGVTNQTFSVEADSSCSWVASSLYPWITVAATSHGSGSGTVTYSVSPNGSANARTGRIVVSNQVFFGVSQAGDTCPVIQISPSVLPDASINVPYTLSLSASGGTGPYTWTLLGQLPTGLAFSGGVLSGTPTSAGNFPFTLGIQDSRGCQGEQSYILKVVECVPPSAPSFTSVPQGTLTAGGSFTLSWSATLGSDTLGSYEVETAPNDSCSNPQRISTKNPWLTLSTTTGWTGTYCARVRAVSGQGCRSDLSAAAKIRVEAAPAQFTVISAAGALTVDKNGPLPANVEVVLRNIGSAAGSLSLATDGSLFSPTPTSFPTVAPGQDVRVRIVFAQGSSAQAGLKTANLFGLWQAGAQPRALSTPVFLTVLDADKVESRGSRLQFRSTNQVFFRYSGAGNPPPQQVTIVNTGTAAVRLAPQIGPGGSWLVVSGDVSTALPAGGSRAFTLSVDRRKRSMEDGQPPLVTGLRFINVDGNPEDAAYGQVIDEEPPAPSAGSGRPPLASGEFSLILGSAVNSRGANDTRFLSDGWIRNQGASEVTADLYWTPAGEDGLLGTRVLKSSLKIGGYESYRLSDLVAGLFRTEEVSGQVEVRSPQLSQLSMRSTTDSISTKGDVIARYGAEIPILVSGQGVRKAAAGRAEIDATKNLFAVIPGIRDAQAGYRTNLIFAETTGSPATVLARVFDVDGALVGLKRVYVGPYSKSQVNSTDTELFGTGKRFDGGTVEVTPDSGEGAVAVFATVIDNQSQSFLTRIADVSSTALSGTRRGSPGSTASEPRFIPAATRSAAANNSFYTTRVAFTNLSRAEVTVTATYLPDKRYNQNSIVRTVRIPARAEGPKAVVFEDVLTGLFNTSADTAGMIKLEGSLGSVSVASETSTPLDPDRAGFGRSISASNPPPGKPQSQAYGTFDANASEVVGTIGSGAPQLIVTHPAIEESFAFRTNLILAELSGQPAGVRIRLVKPGSGVSLGEKEYSLDRHERLQINRVIRDIVASDSDFQDIQIEVAAATGNGRVLALVTKIDNNPESKRADIFILGGSVGGSPVSLGD